MTPLAPRCAVVTLSRVAHPTAPALDVLCSIAGAAHVDLASSASPAHLCAIADKLRAAARREANVCHRRALSAQADAFAALADVARTLHRYGDA